MRIAVVNNFYPPRVGGSAHLSEALASGYARDGHEVLVLTAAYGHAPAEELAGGTRIVRLPAFRLPLSRLAVNFDLAFTMRPSLRRTVHALLSDFRPDVVHLHGQFFDLTWAAGIWAGNHGVPSLLTVHTRLESPSPWYQSVFSALDAVVVAPILRRFKPRCVVLDRHMRDYIARKYATAISGTVPIPVGLDPRWARGGDPRLIREKLGLGDDPVILSTGHVIQLRDRLALVEALPKVLAEAPATKLLVVGGIYYDQFLRRARELGVEKSIITTGAVPKSDVPHYYAAATVEAHSLQGIGVGIADLEAMAAGVPLVVAVEHDNFLGLSLADRECLHLVPPNAPDELAERLIETIADPEGAKRLGKAGAALVDEHFAMDSVIAKHLAVLGELALSR